VQGYPLRSTLACLSSGHNYCAERRRVRCTHCKRMMRLRGGCDLSTCDDQDLTGIGCASEGTWVYGTAMIFGVGDLCRFVVIGYL
jgi:hypothetical protein